MKLLPQPGARYQSKLLEFVLAAVAAMVIFVPLNQYWQNVSAPISSAVFTDKSSDGEVLCNGLAYDPTFTVPQRGFPFRIQAGGTCVPYDNAIAILLDGVIAAVVAVAAASLGTWLLWARLTTNRKAHG